ncbi:S-adenosyl-L-methionine-dependent methyltransferase [Talaromyces proteolyticus]|uniref:S-adenosyl-L-methionine-dependent methyltransferase n=1 Tax=Talaromyces proteolyticus TaxID=1131652 RepID=A0AAD4L020_9EURO|nr:S-adenosyl-L-methionine-dependent methyltransferase [Talaromyces proteolyticus]KAH8701606.1 S-adenosyl-L-methionine-dependent methyltransferase [Talaromyces proteolyticus]
MESTFLSLSSKQAAGYADARKSYPRAFINFIVDHHRAIGGKTEVLLDVGCGPGNSTRAFAPHFDHVYGVDPGDAMIKTAINMGGQSVSEAPISYHICRAEEVDKLNEPAQGAVDMINVTSAAHWFDMPKFWTAAAKALKPGGTVSLWNTIPTHTDLRNPNHEKVKEIMDHFSNAVLGPYVTPGNALARSGYANLNMPWDQAETADLFEKETLLRKRWHADDERAKAMGFFSGLTRQEWLLKDVKAIWGSMSPVIRWREAHPELADTDQDCVEVVMKQLCETIGTPNGLEDGTTMYGGVSIVLLCIKRAA